MPRYEPRLPQVASEEPGAEPEPMEDLPAADGYGTGRMMAGVIGILGWVGLLAGVLVLVLTFTLGPAGLSASLLGLPLGLVAGGVIIVISILLVLAGQLAHAVFDGASAARNLVSIEKAKALM
jgi:hypothetical protein